MSKLSDAKPLAGLDPAVKCIAEAIAFMATGMMQEAAESDPTTAALYTTAYLKCIQAIYGKDVADELRDEFIEAQTGLSIEQVKAMSELGVKISSVMGDDGDDSN